ncbi:MAG: peptidyl-prolyl cis-trans isomerase [Sulfurospirillum sp.]|nr:peptidyl-prolyl cis-trans isomerase [Sulfurospirillum sp.]MBL0703369.1 peptidyl-prolyl cis-trans isomerase [Sulfurospirillum sp.]
MKTTFRLLVSMFVCVSFGFSGIITGISVIVNDEPITLYEVYKYSKKFKITRKESLDVLIRQKLEESQIKQFHIDADIFEVDKYIESIANRNNISKYEFFNMLKKENVKIDDYKKQIKQQIKRDKLYQSIYKDKLKGVEDSEIKEFYDKNPTDFMQANSFNLTIYTSQNDKDLQAIQKNPMLQLESVKIEKRFLTEETLNNQLKTLLNATEQGKFTQIVTIQNRSTMFYIEEKKDFKKVSYENAKNSIYRAISKQKESKVIKDYFEKLRASATIKVLRSPS